MNFRHRITIKQDESPDGAEIGVTDWQTVIEDVPCNIHEVSGQESFRGLQLEATTKRIIEMRYLTSITISPTMQVTDGLSRTMQIESVVDKQGRQRYLFLLCMEAGV